MNEVEEAVSRANKKAVELRKTPFHYEGVDLREELKKYARTKTLRPHLDLRRLPILKVRYSPVAPGVGGHAYYGRRGRIILTIAVNAHLSEVLEILLHELVHHATPLDAHHGSQFIGRLNNAAKELWGVFVEDTLRVPKGEHKNRAYAIDTLLQSQLKAKLNAEKVQCLLDNDEFVVLDLDGTPVGTLSALAAGA